MDRLTAEDVRDALRPIQDPEILISIVDLGLVRGIEVSPEGSSVTVAMTLTTPFCPEGPMIIDQVREVLRSLPGVADESVELVWQPPWDPARDASDEVKAELGIWD